MWYKTLYWNRGTSRRSVWALKFANFSSNENVQNIENNENLQNITFSFKLSKSPLKMGQLCTFLNKLFVVRITIDLVFKRFFCDTWSRACKTRSQSRETNNTPDVENNYRIEVKITFMLIAYLVLLCEFFGEFSIFQFCRP